MKYSFSVFITTSCVFAGMALFHQSSHAQDVYGGTYEGSYSYDAHGALTGPAAISPTVLAFASEQISAKIAERIAR